MQKYKCRANNFPEAGNNRLCTGDTLSVQRLCKYNTTDLTAKTPMRQGQFTYYELGAMNDDREASRSLARISIIEQGTLNFELLIRTPYRFEFIRMNSQGILIGIRSEFGDPCSIFVIRALRPVIRALSFLAEQPYRPYLRNLR